MEKKFSTEGTNQRFNSDWIATDDDFSRWCFAKNPVFVYSVDYLHVFTRYRNRCFDYYVGLGIRFTHCPTYRNSGKINQLIELPLKIGMKYNFNYKKE